MRPVRYTPPLDIPGSYIVSDTAATFNVTINFVDEFSGHDYSYLRETKAGEKMYFKMPPEYYPSVATLTPVGTDFELSSSQGVTIRSDEYWDYIDSNSSQDAVFKQISIKTDATGDMPSAIQYIQKIRDQLSRVSLEYAEGNATGAEELAATAYRDFEHIKAELDQRNATDLSEQTEQMLRVELVDLIRDRANSQGVDDKIAAINAKLDEAIVIVPEFPIASIGVLAGLIGIIGFIGRLKLFGK